MKNHYSRGTQNWKCTSSTKGAFLLQYARKVSNLLASEKSVQFSPKSPDSVNHSKEEITLSFLSGGTSGEPALVIHSPSTITAAVDGLVKRLGNYPIDSVCCLPLWHVGGWMQLERAWRTGGEILFCDYREIRELSIQEEILDKWISLVPTQLQELIKSNNAVENLKLARGIFVGGAEMSEHLISSIRSIGLSVFPCYGSSETAGMITLLDSDSFLQGIEGVGRALPHAEIRVNSASGHIELRSESLCLSRGGIGYQKNMWFETRDLGKLDNEGNLSIFGRSDRIINTGGEKVDPSLIEKILYSTGYVEECLVYGEPDKKWGHKVVACVCPENIDLFRLQAAVKGKLVGPMKPKVWKTMEVNFLSEMGKPLT